VIHLNIAELSLTQTFGELAASATRLGMQSCWSIPIISSSQQPLGLLLVLSPRAGEATAQEKMLLEAGSRTAAIAIEHRYLTDLLAFQAGHDSLTRLPNRSSFEARLQDAIAHAGEHSEQLALFYVDLDRFKEVNDTFGHCGGDALLRQAAARLRRCIRHTDMLARIGGDEFSLLLTGLRDTSEANRLAEVILHAFQSPFTISGWPVHVTSSIGISFYPGDGLDAPTLQRNSDTAMYRVKNTGKNSFRCYAGDGQPGAELVASSERVQ
jgi:diguanylate cyclase (GGDEF)-like protein